VGYLVGALEGTLVGFLEGSITLHFAVAGNMADLNAKESTQETMVSLIGMILGVYAARALQHNVQFWNWTIFIVLTVIHIWANYRGVTLLRLRTLNRARADLVLGPLIRHSTTQLVSELSMFATGSVASRANVILNDSYCSALVPGPEHVQESLWYAVEKYVLGRDTLQLGMSLVTLLQQRYTPQMSPTNMERYRIAILDPQHHRQDTAAVGIALLTGATARDQLKAYVHAHLVLALVDQYRIISLPLSADAILDQTEHVIHEHWFGRSPGSSEEHKEDWLVAELRRKGWEVDGRVYLGFSPRRSHIQTVTTIHEPFSAIGNDDNRGGEAKKVK
jgi:hypothetical protein